MKPKFIPEVSCYAKTEDGIIHDLIAEGKQGKGLTAVDGSDVWHIDDKCVTEFYPYLYGFEWFITAVHKKILSVMFLSQGCLSSSFDEADIYQSQSEAREALRKIMRKRSFKSWRFQMHSRKKKL